MPALPFKVEIAGRTLLGVVVESEREYQTLLAWLAAHGMELGAGPGATAAPADRPAAEERPRGRPSRDEEIAAAIDTLDDELERCGSIKAQARAVRTYLEARNSTGDPPPGLSTIETYISVYRKPRSSRALKIAKKFSGG